MFLTEITQIKAACLHHIGSKVLDEGIVLSNDVLQLDDDSRKTLSPTAFLHSKMMKSIVLKMRLD